MYQKICRVAAYNFVEYEGIKFCGDTNQTALYRIDSSGEPRILTDHQVAKYRSYAYTKCGIIGKKVFFMSGKSNIVSVFDIKKNELRKIEINLNEDYLNGNILFWESAVNEKYFFAVGYQCPVIVRIDAETNEVKMLDFCIDDFRNESRKGDSPDYFFVDGYVNYKGGFFIPISRESSLLFLDNDMNGYEIIYTGGFVKKILSISSRDEEIWMTDFNSDTGYVSIWNINTKEVKNVILPSRGLWYAPKFFDGYAYFFPMSNEGKVYRVDTMTLHCELFERLDELFREEDNKELNNRNSNTMMVQQEGSIVTFIRRPDYTWFTYDFETDELTSAVYEITDEAYLKALEKDYYDQIFDKCVGKAEVVNEEELPLSEYLERLKI